MDRAALERLRQEHTREAIRLSFARGASRSYLRDAVYGATDGIVTTFAVVAGAQGAGLASGVAVILGIANLVADGFSMAAGNFLGSRAELQMRDHIARTELEHIRLVPEGEREEVRQIFERKGFSGPDLERAVEIITSDRSRWLDTMLREEFGLEDRPVSPWRAAAVTWAAFMAAGALPLSAYVADLVLPGRIGAPFSWSVGLSLGAFFLTGALKGRFVGRSWAVSGLETAVVGVLASAAAYLLGAALRPIIPI